MDINRASKNPPVLKADRTFSSLSQDYIYRVEVRVHYFLLQVLAVAESLNPLVRDFDGR